jgi:hypothetical protein
LTEQYLIHLYQHTSQLIEYLFETEYGAQYYVTFRPAHYQFKIDCVPCQNVFEVSFNPESTSPVPDYRIRNTVIHSIRKFIDEQRAPLLYVCDNLDQREFSRQRLFSRWFDESNTRELQHGCRVIKVDDYTLIVGIVSFQWDTHFNHYFEQIEHSYL